MPWLVCGGSLDLDFCLVPPLLNLSFALLPWQSPVFLLVTCMSRVRSEEAASVELALDLPGNLRVVISGPASSSGLATQLFNHVAAFSPSGSDPSEFELVTEPLASPVGGARLSGLETRDQVRRSLSPCPKVLLESGVRLCGSSLSGKQRVLRAWTCGQWALAVKNNRIGRPDRTPPIDLKNRFYAVLQGPGLSKPTIFRSSAGYWNCIGSLAGSSSISQSFPSELEAKVYLQAAGEVEFDFAQ